MLATQICSLVKKNAEADGNAALECFIKSNYIAGLGITAKYILGLDFEQDSMACH